MPLVNAKCTNCGANLEVDNAQDAAICEFCGSAYIVEKAINNYNIKNDIKAEVVNIYGSQNSDFVIKAGVLEEYKGADTKVVIPDGVIEIGSQAFYYVGKYITDIVISKSVRKISWNSGESNHYCNADVFENCESLLNIKVDSKNSMFSSIDGVLFDKSGTCLLVFPKGRKGSYTIPNGVIKIGDSAFKYCRSISEIIIPSSVTELGDSAFAYCRNLSKVVCSTKLVKTIKNSSYYSLRDEETINKYAHGTPWKKAKFPTFCTKCATKLNLFGKCPNCG